MSEAVLLSSGGGMLYEIFDGFVESVLDGYILTSEETGREFLCIGDVKAATMACEEYIRLSENIGGIKNARK